MARYDKYDPMAGGFRAALAEDWPEASQGEPVGVSLDANGRVVPGTGGQSGLAGVLVVTPTAPKKAGDVVDVMTSGEIVECEGLDAGTAYFADADGSVGTAGGAIGHTVEAARLVVRVTKGASA